MSKVNLTINLLIMEKAVEHLKIANFTLNNITGKPIVPAHKLDNEQWFNALELTKLEAEKSVLLGEKRT